ncbi:MAG: UDP-N-acetylmuramate dehydrogenase [Firmicutes bacterium]|nr:UDP-N-acetylmuramate dehydrogenase [Bacillota bacterium]
MSELILELKKALGDENILADEPMSAHTTFRTGGNADIFILAKNIDSLKTAISAFRSKNIPFMMIGNGSDLLVRDKGIRGAVIKLCGDFCSLRADNTLLFAGAGASLAEAASYAAKSGLSGLEFASGIPGSIGGGLFMNAGAYGGELKDRFLCAEIMDEDLNIVSLNTDDMKFGYRKSILSERNIILLSAQFKLIPQKSELIREEMSRLNSMRREKQPLNFPSAGSTFKRPEGYFAGKLIEDAGLRGMSIGGAKVSEKHCGFIINTGNAKSSDILELIAFCQKRVFEAFGVKLEPEVKIIGEE